MQEDTLVAPIALDVAAETLRERLPELPIGQIVYLGGGSSSAFAADDRFVFKFPKVSAEYEQVARFYEAEAKLLPALRAAVRPHELPEQTHYLGGPCAHFAGPVTGYRFFTGTQVSQSEFDAAGLRALAHLVGDFLSRLHTTDLDTMSELGLDRVTEDEIRAGWWRSYEAHRKNAFPLLERPERQWITDLYDRFLADAPNVDPRIALTHGDFGPENVLLPAAADRLQVIDLDDIGIGSAYGDFCAWLGHYGKRFLSDALDRYVLPVDDLFFATTEFYYGRIPGAYISHGVAHQNERFVQFGKQLLYEAMERSKTW